MILGFLEDNTGLLISTYLNSKSDSNSEILFYGPYLFLSKFVNSEYLYNLLIIFLIFVNFILFKRFFSKFFEEKSIQNILTLIIIFSPYFLYRLQSHPALLNIWIAPLVIMFLLDLSTGNKSKLYFFIYGIILGLLSLVSNYIGFFSILFSLIYISFFIFSNIKYKKIVLQYFVNFSIFIISTTIPLIVINYNYVYSNFFLGQNVSEDYKNFKVVRPIEDFFTFSSRPWYYFLPSTDNPVFGSLSSYVIQELQSKWGNFLTFNYFKSEHSSSFLGITNLTLAIFGFRFIRKNKEKYITNIRFLLYSGLVLILFTFPPYITINDFKLYTPSYLLYVFFPMFRVLSRIGSIILIIELIFTGFGIKYIITKLQKNNLKKIYILFIQILLLTFSLSEFIVPIKVTKANSLPEIFTFIKEETLSTESFAVIPFSKYNESFYWSHVYQRKIISLNQNFYINGNIISKENFSQNILYTCDGLRELKKLNVNYLIFFKHESKDYNQKFDFLKKNLEIMKTIGDYKLPYEENYLIIKVINLGDTKSNLGTIFKVPETLICQ